MERSSKSLCQVPVAVELIDLGNSGNNADMSDMVWYGFRLLERNAEKDNGMVMSSNDSQSPSNHAVASFLVSVSEGRKLSHCNLSPGSSGLAHLAGIIFA